MKFGPRSPLEARGAINVHTIRAGAQAIKKGSVIGEREIAALVAAKIESLVCAELEPGELSEDAAAEEIGRALVGANVTLDAAHTGRANLRASAAGVFVVDADVVARINTIDEAITLATVSPDLPVRAGAYVATVKIIPFGVAASAVEAACAIARSASSSISVAPFRGRRAGLVLTKFAATHARILDRAAHTQAARLEMVGSEIARELRVDHDVAAVAAALAALSAAKLDPILVMGASAIVDRRDVIPEALVRAGGSIVRFGMPSDPGNLLLLGTLAGATVIGLPGCARSPDRSGFDWVLEHVCADLPIAASAMGALGVGGLIVGGPRLVPLRPAGEPGTAPAAAIILAAGHSSRMGANKLLVELEGMPLVRHVAMAALGSRARPVVVVTGNDRDRVEAALAGLDVRFVHNDAFATGMASSLRAGIASVGDAPAAMICLGDMPRVTRAHLDRLLDELSSVGDDRTILIPTFERKRGNPVVLGRAHFAAIGELTGDVGARALIERNAAHVVTVAFEDPAVLVDVDTPEALAALRADQ